MYSTILYSTLQVEGGYYSDTELQCQAFQICVRDGLGDLTKYSFLCPNGSLFDQQYFICDFWFNVDCSQAESLYFLNEDIDAERQANIGAVFTGKPAVVGGQGRGNSLQGQASGGSRGQGGGFSGGRGQQGGGGVRPGSGYGSPRGTRDVVRVVENLLEEQGEEEGDWE